MQENATQTQLTITEWAKKENERIEGEQMQAWEERGYKRYQMPLKDVVR